jgi:diguanylate cyclase (GGDEF)-like protein
VLTGLTNQAALQRKAERLVAQRQPPAVAALVHIDLPDMPALETLLGSPAVDGLIKQVGEALQARVRSSDTVARIADASFAVLLPGCPPDVALRLAQEIQATLAAVPLPMGAHAAFCEPSIGLASLTSGTGSAAQWLAQAAEHARALADPSPTRDDYITRMDDLITGTGSLEEAG